MRRIILLLPFLCALAITGTAQVTNPSFENWETDTTEFAGFGANIPADTFAYSDPVGWTSSNAVTGADSLGGIFFVNQSSDAIYGTSAIQCVTGTMPLPLIPNVPINITLPGFALNGNFPINPQGLLLNGNISPIIVPGAGEPVSGRLGSLGGYVKYTPVFNPNTNAPDTLLIWATLKKNGIAIADAIYKSNDTISTYTAFDAPFIYHSCLIPDTLIVMVASSIPSFGSLLSGGNSGLVPGSVLLVDSIFTTPLAGNFPFPPIANADNDTTEKNTPKNLIVLNNDEDCNNDPLTVSIVTPPVNGTASVNGSGEIVYTPTTGFVGKDSLIYSITDGTGSGTGVAKSKILVIPHTGINDVKLTALSLYPNPATNVVNISLDATGEHTINVYNSIGSLVESKAITSGKATMDVSTYATGAYYVKVIDADGNTIGNSKFSVNK
jgi:hypothetical protein